MIDSIEDDEIFIDIIEQLTITTIRREKSQISDRMLKIQKNLVFFENREKFNPFYVFMRFASY